MTILTRTDQPATPLTLSSFSTTGSMSAGSDQLTVANASGLSVGDWVIVATGGEAGGGTRGSGLGVGGAWPALSYADATAMNADTSQANLTCCWLEDSGDVRYWNDDTSEWVTPPASEYYTTKVVPKALWAEITNKAGNVLTLSETASAATTNAPVYFDNWGILQDEMTAGNNITLPAGAFAVSDMLRVANFDGYQIIGQGWDRTKLFTPPGASHGGIAVTGCDNCLLDNFSFDLNFKNDSYSFRWANGRAPVASSPFPETWRGTGASWGFGVKLESVVNGTVRRFRAINGSQQAVTTSFCTNTWAYRCKAELTEPLRQYVQWAFQWADSWGGGCVECDVNSPYLITGFEAFKSTGVQFIRCYGRNASCAVNSSDDCLYDSLRLAIEAGSFFTTAPFAFSTSTALIDCNRNISGGYATLTNRFVNPTITISGYPDTVTPYRPIVFTMSGTSAPVSISGTYDTDAVSPRGLIDVQPSPVSGNTFGGIGVRTNTVPVTIEGIRIKSTMISPSTTNVIHLEGTNPVVSVTNSIFDGSITGSTANLTTSGNQTNAEYEA